MLEPPPPPLPLPETLHTANEITLGVLDYSQANRTMCELASKLQMSSAAAHRLRAFSYQQRCGDFRSLSLLRFRETENYQRITMAVKIS